MTFHFEHSNRVKIESQAAARAGGSATSIRTAVEKRRGTSQAGIESRIVGNIDPSRMITAQPGACKFRIAVQTNVRTNEQTSMRYTESAATVGR